MFILLPLDKLQFKCVTIMFILPPLDATLRITVQIRYHYVYSAALRCHFKNYSSNTIPLSIFCRQYLPSQKLQFKYDTIMFILPPLDSISRI